MIAGGILLLFLVLMVAGMPVFLSMGIAALAGTLALSGPDMLLTNFALGAYSQLDAFTLLAIPLYLLAGTLLEATGLSRKLFDFADMLCSGVRGGLGVATVIACSIFAAISGSSVATAATIGLVALPIMSAHGYEKHVSGALVAAGGTLGILIPPSIPLIIFGVMTNESIGALFMAGVVPGILLALVMAVYTSVTCKIARTPVRRTMAQKFALAREALSVLVLPVLVFAGIYTGIATVTEIAAMAVLYVLVLGVATRTLTRQGLASATLSALNANVMIFVLVAFGGIMGEMLNNSGVPQTLLAAIKDLGLPPLGVFSLIVIVYLILGMFLEALSMMIITIPVLYPIATAIGIPPLAFGIVVVLAIEAGQITPPVGINLFTIAKIGDVPFVPLLRAIIPYVVMLVVAMYVMYFVPQLATWLPSTMNYGK